MMTRKPRLMQVQMQQRPCRCPSRRVASPSRGSRLSSPTGPTASIRRRWLPRGRVLTLPVLDSIDRRPARPRGPCRRRGPAALLFYPGGWSRSCNDGLRAFQSVASRVPSTLGVVVVAVTPELPRHARETAARNGLDISRRDRPLLPVRQDARARLQAAGRTPADRARLRACGSSTGTARGAMTCRCRR